MGGDPYPCSFCGIAYSDPTEIVVNQGSGAGSGAAICAGCFHIAAEEFSRSRADKKLSPKAPCGICGERIEVRELDPCHVWMTSFDDRMGWSWMGHISCIKAMLGSDPPGLI
jgi:hypothetical protein